MTADTTARDVVAALRQENADLRRERDEARSNAEQFRNSMYAVEEHVHRATAGADALAAQLAEAEKRNAVLAKALEPFAAEWNDSWCPEQNAGFKIGDDETVTGGGGCSLTAGDLRRAAQALTPAANGETGTEAGHGPTNTGDGDGR